MSVFLVLYISLTTSILGPCPSFLEVVQAYGDLLIDAKYVSMNFEVETKGKMPSDNDSSEMTIVWHDGQVLYLDREFERLVAKNYTILVSHEAQTIDIVDHVVPLSKIDVLSEMNKWLIQGTEDYSVDCKTFSDKLTYTFVSGAQGPVKEATYEFKKNKNILTRFTQVYRSEYSNIDVVTMKFTNYDFDSMKHLSRFELSHYNDKREKTIKPMGKKHYAGYQIIHNTMK